MNLIFYISEIVAAITILSIILYLISKTKREVKYLENKLLYLETNLNMNAIDQELRLHFTSKYEHRLNNYLKMDSRSRADKLYSDMKLLLTHMSRKPNLDLLNLQNSTSYPNYSELLYLGNNLNMICKILAFKNLNIFYLMKFYDKFKINEFWESIPLFFLTVIRKYKKGFWNNIENAHLDYIRFKKYFIEDIIDENSEKITSD